MIFINALLDYHTHTTHSWDAKNTVGEMCQSAVDKGITEICFTEHFALREGDPCCDYIDFEQYSRDIEFAKDVFQGRLIVKKGLEIGEPHYKRDEINSRIKGQDLDFIIGSVHSIDGVDLKDYIIHRDQISSYRGYFEELLETVSVGDLDVIGHFDLLRRYAFDSSGRYRHADFQELIYEILKKAVSRNIGLEVNTSGFRSSSTEIFPSRAILKEYRDLKGEILTVGSDSHLTDTIGYNIGSVYLMLKQIGFKSVFSFEKRKPKAVEL
ncbi:histidinol-phosphatase (PHP family) [Alkalibaculum bacchi]|uniref:Histidinol-phosphatase n=1 Tax=Alkalibaculum bacchi TaxID=645887 RepID=A0A366ICM6_9FIRM|nr:histidinol-phosphatase HisJ family protein [Alkalibaculum bacchi]RBP66658.1 histidinol-phosphatase (PHP family) [Alkalibaculum bacchi]